MMRGHRFAVLLALAAACGTGDPGRDVRADRAGVADSAASTVGAVNASAPAPVEMPVPAAAAAPDRGATAWRALELPSEPWSQSAESPDALLRRVRDVVAAQLEEPDAGVLPTRLESQSADSAVGLLVHPDQADDSVRDVEFRLHMRRDASEWRVAGVDRRERCRRGVSPGGVCA